MEENTRIAIAAVIVDNPDAVEAMNAVLHEYSAYIIGRMGIPYRKKNISLISVAIDAPSEIISAMTGKLGKISGITVKTAYSKV